LNQQQTKISPSQIVSRFCLL